MKKNKKILFCPCHYVYDEFFGGSEPLWAYKIADSMCSTLNGSIVVTGFKKLLKSKKYTIIELQNNKDDIDMSFYNSFLFMIKYTLKSYILLKKYNFDILHHILPFLIGKTFNLNFVFRRKDVKYVIGPIQTPLAFKDKDVSVSNIRGKKNKETLKEMLFGYIYLLLKPILRYLSDKTLSSADKIIVINSYTKNVLITRGINSEKIIIITPGIDTKEFIYPSKKRKRKKFELLTVSYLIERKAVDLLILAVEKVLKTYKNIYLRIVGSGPQEDYLRKIVKEKKMENNVIFEGFVENYKVSKYYQKADIFLTMSRDESWGQMYLEAMASGLPIISTKNNGSESIIRNSINGFLIDVDDYSKMAEKIIILIKDRSKLEKMSLDARNIAVKNYCWNKIINKYNDLYAKL